MCYEAEARMAALLNPERILPACLAGLAIAVWWLANPYVGFGHDSLFYTAEAMLRGGLAPLALDTFFRFGSQGNFSAFIAPYSLLLQSVDPAIAALAVTLIAKLVWLGGLAMVCRAIVPGPQRWLALSLVLILSPYYEPFRIFAYGESFATPRIWAEAVGMWVIVLAASKRWWSACFALVGACMLHPLMGLPLVILLSLWSLAFFTRARRHAQWLQWIGVLAIGIATVGALYALRVPPFDRLLQTYDNAWWQIVLERNAVTVVQAWNVEELARLTSWLALLVPICERLPRGSAARTLAAASGFAAVTCLLLWIFGSLARNVLLVQLQPWRVMWLVQVLVPVLWLASWTASARPALRWLDWAQIALVLAALVTATWNGLILAVLAWALHRWGHRLVVKRARRAAILVALVALLTIAVSRLAGLNGLVIMSAVTRDTRFPWLRAVAAEPVVWLLVAASAWGALRFWETRHSARVALRTALYGFSGTVAVVSLSFWLFEAHARMETDSAPPWVAALRARISPVATVYWSRPAAVTWLQLRHAHYASNIQGASVLFSRSGALELQRRLERLRAAGLASGPAAWAGEAGAESLNDSRALLLCQDPALDYVLADGVWPGAQALASGDAGKHLSIFRCEAMRHAIAT